MAVQNEFLRGKPKDVSGEQLIRFVFRTITALIIFFGIWASTQRFCFLMNYEPGWVGPPMYILHLRGGSTYPLYNPFLIFWWMLLFYTRLDIHPYLYGAMRIAGYTSVIAIAFLLFMEFFLIPHRKENIFGTARWATDRDLKKAGLLGTRTAAGFFP